MTIAYWCVLIVIVFPYVFTLLAKWDRQFSNDRPREYLSQLEGWKKRAHYVQLNSFESNPAFMAAVIIAHQLHAIQPLIDTLAVIFVVTRILYALSYLSNKALLRTFFWTIGFLCVIGLFIISLPNHSI